MLIKLGRAIINHAFKKLLLEIEWRNFKPRLQGGVSIKVGEAIKILPCGKKPINPRVPLPSGAQPISAIPEYPLHAERSQLAIAYPLPIVAQPIGTIIV